MKTFLNVSVLSLGLLLAGSGMAQGSCSVDYTTVNSWNTGGQQDVKITNHSTAKTGWELCWSFNGSEQINNLWNGSYTTNGKNVCVKNVSNNASLPSNGSVTFGFTHTSVPGAKPTNFTLNGVLCGLPAAVSSAQTTSLSTSRSSLAPSSAAPSSRAPASSAPASSAPASSARSSLAPSSASNAARWLIDADKSALNFVSIKNTSVAENFTFTQLRGTVAANGNATLTIPLVSVATGIDTRNTRLQNLLFETAVIPDLHFTTQLNLAAIDAMPVGSLANQSFTGNLILHGVNKAITFDATIIKFSDTSVSVSPRNPILINSADFDLNAGIEALRALAGVVNIAERVPVYFKISLTKNNPTNQPALVLKPAPIAPQNLMGSVSQSTGLASLTWADVTTGETGFVVRRKGADGRWVSLAKTAPNAVAYSDDLASIPGSYEYKVISLVDSIPSAATPVLALGYVTGASSSSALSSRAASSVPALVGNAVQGKIDWENPEIGCKFCHAVNPDGTAGASLSKIDPKNLRFTTVSGLAKYIEDAMPKSSAEVCVGQCAADTAAYFLSLMPVPLSSSMSSSSRAQSSALSSVVASSRPNSSAVAVSTPASSLARSSSSAVTLASSRASAVSSSAAALNGAQLYIDHGCASCHGARGENPARPILVDSWTRASLINKIDVSMPLSQPSSCVGACATAIADHILTWKPVVSCNANEEVLPRRLRLLTNREYINTVNDLLGVTTGATIAASFEPDTSVKGFDNNAAASNINSTRMSAYWAAAEKLAEAANLTNLLGCASNSTRQQCANTFVPAFGKKAFRRPLVTAEQTSYTALFNLGSSNELGARMVIHSMLTSPNFLYRSEIGASAGILTAYETASLLSYTFLGSMPDATLMTEADNNRLSTPAQLRTQAERLLSQPKAGDQLSHFAMQWLHVGDVANLQRDKTLYPQFTQVTGAAMKAELDLFLKEIFIKPGYKIADLFNPGFTFLNDTLASYYGISGVSGSNFQKVTTTSQRGGILHMGAITASLSSPKESNPIHRGLLVRRNLLCQDFAPPPPNIGEVEPLNPSKPTRERFAAHTSNPNCQSCHQYIDNIGFGFENYDAVGKFRTTEGNNLTVDASGSISGLAVMTASDSYNFNDLRGLAGVLATSGAESTSACANKQYMRFVTGVAEPNQCAINASYSRWQNKSTDLRDMLLETVTSPNFLIRR